MKKKLEYVVCLAGEEKEEKWVGSMRLKGMTGDWEWGEKGKIKEVGFLS